MVLNTLSKSFHSWTRTKLMGHISGIRMPSQLGGFSHQQSQFGSQMIQTVAHICAAKQLSHACLFVDVRGAYHYLVRELVMGIEDDDDLAGVIANIAQHGMDANGVKLWSTLPSILERVRADPKLVSLLKEIHADTWMTMAQSNGADGTLRTRRGSRPGSPVADAVYHVLMMDLHIEVHRILEGCDKVVQGFDAASIPITATTWADDLAVPVITETASDLIPAIQEVVSRVYTAFERRGLELNMQKNKTAAVLSFKGPAAATHRKTYLLCQHPGISFSLTGGRERWLHFTGTYRHLGAVYCADGVMTREVNSRIGAANASFQQLRKILFGNKHIPTATRLRLLEALIFSKLTYGLSTWSSLGVGLLEKVESFMLRCQRFVCGFRQEGSHDEFKGQFEIPGLHHRLMQHRLIYAASVWIHGPPLLQELLETEEQAATTSWMTALRHDLEVCRDLLGEKFPCASISLEDLKLYWRTNLQEWKRTVKKAYRKLVAQEGAAADARGWHGQVIEELRKNGATFQGGIQAIPSGNFVCHCGKSCRSAQGLAVHRWKVHGEHAPEHQYAKGAHCPVCLKWLWTSHRVRMHLSYIPRSGRPNSCFQALQQQGAAAFTTEEVVRAPPPEVAGMRLDALDCAGPAAPLQRAVDKEIAQVEKELAQHQEQKKNYPSYEEIDLVQVESFSRSFSTILQTWWTQFGQSDEEGYEIWNAFVDFFGTLEVPVPIFEMIFVEWLQAIMPDILARWEDGFAEHVAEKMLYKLAMEMDYMRSTSRGSELQNRLQGLQQLRSREDEAPPHRPVRRGPMTRRGSNRVYKPALRRYLDEDHWHEQCLALQWENSTKDVATPIYRQVAGRPCFLVIHLFSGRRRSGDYHDEVMRLADGKGFDVRVLSLDTAVHHEVGDLTAGRTTWSNVMILAREGKVAGALAGPPCETILAATPEERRSAMGTPRANDEGAETSEVRRTLCLTSGLVDGGDALLWGAHDDWAPWPTIWPKPGDDFSDATISSPSTTTRDCVTGYSTTELGGISSEAHRDHDTPSSLLPPFHVQMEGEWATCCVPCNWT